MKKLKFEIGKWYQTKSVDQYIGKFVKLEGRDNGYDKFWSYDWISANDYDTNTTISWMPVDKVEEIPIEEIQQYLPKGHPDLNITFKTGDYIVITQNNKSGWNGTVNYCYKLIDSNQKDNHYYKKDFRIALENSEIKARHATPKEIERWNREGEEYDINTIEEQKLFKLPEKWQIKLTKENAKILGDWRTLGNVGVFTDDIPHGYMKCGEGLWNTYKYPDCTEINFEQFKKYVLGSDYDIDKKPEKMDKSKRVVHCTTQGQWDFVCEKLSRKSKVGYLQQNNNCCIKLDYPAQSWSLEYAKDYFKILSFQKWLDENGYVFEEEVKVNDWVIIIETYSGDTYKKGDIVQISHIKDNKYQTLELHKQYSTWGGWLENRHFRKLSEEEAKPKPVDKWSVGTYVVALKDAIYNDLKKGDIDEVERNDGNIKWLKKYSSLNIVTPEDEFQWFATKTEAEEFAKTLTKTNNANEMKAKYKIEDFKYPDVVKCTNKKQWIQFNKHHKLSDYENRCVYYLAKSHGKSTNEYGSGYNTYNFKDIIFPQESIIVGTYIRYKGTKEGRSDLWETWFGKYGVKVGDVGKIHSIKTNGYQFFIKDNIRKHVTSGFLLKEDFDVISEKEYLAGCKTESNSLIEGTIYKHSSGTICRWSIDDSKNHLYKEQGKIGIVGFTSEPGNYSNTPDEFVLATSDEIKWLEACEKAGKFISKEEALEVKNNLNILDQWLVDTKAKNLSLKELDTYVVNSTNCPFNEIYMELKGTSHTDKVRILYDQWNGLYGLGKTAQPVVKNTISTRRLEPVPIMNPLLIDDVPSKPIIHKKTSRQLQEIKPIMNKVN